MPCKDATITGFGWSLSHLFKVRIEHLQEICKNETVQSLLKLRETDGLMHQIATAELFERTEPQALRFQSKMMSRWMSGQMPVFLTHHGHLIEQLWVPVFQRSFLHPQHTAIYRLHCFLVCQSCQQGQLQPSQAPLDAILAPMLTDPNELVRQFNAGQTLVISSFTLGLKQVLPHVTLTSAMESDIGRISEAIMMTHTLSLSHDAFDVLMMLPRYTARSAFLEKLVLRLNSVIGTSWVQCACRLLNQVMRQNPEKVAAIQALLAASFEEAVTFRFDILAGLSADFVRSEWVSVAVAATKSEFSGVISLECFQRFFMLGRHYDQVDPDEYDQLFKQLLRELKEQEATGVAWNQIVLPEVLITIQEQQIAAQLIDMKLIAMLRCIAVGLEQTQFNFTSTASSLIDLLFLIDNQELQKKVFDHMLKLFSIDRDELSFDEQIQFVCLFMASLLKAVPLMYTSQRILFKREIEDKLSKSDSSLLGQKIGIMMALMNLSDTDALCCLGAIKCANMHLLDEFADRQPYNKIVLMFQLLCQIRDLLEKDLVHDDHNELLTSAIRSKQPVIICSMLTYAQQLFLRHKKVFSDDSLTALSSLLDHAELQVREKVLNLLMTLVPRLSAHQCGLLSSHRGRGASFEARWMHDFIGYQPAVQQRRLTIM